MPVVGIRPKERGDFVGVVKKDQRSLRWGGRAGERVKMPLLCFVLTHMGGRPSSFSLLLMLQSVLETLLLADAKLKPHEFCSHSLL